MKWLDAARTLRASRFPVFTDKEFRALTRATPAAAKFMLIRWTRRGLLTRLKRGLYALAEPAPPPWVVANHLYKPSYVSLSTALAYHGLIPESPYAVTSVTTKTTREFETGGRAYLYRTIRPAAFTGYRPVTVGDHVVLMAEPAKAAADHLYFVFLRRETLNERLALDRVERRAVVGFLRRFGNPRLPRWFENDLTLRDRRAAR